ncbi:MAG: hypothetical protein ACR2LQ_11075 [Acidimicrobiales bacterium]
MTELTVLDDPAAGPLVRKTSRSAPDRHRLEHEGELLRAAQHPGVVELVSDDGELTTRYVGSHTIETAQSMGVTRAAALVASIADTLADLHALGLVHGRVEPSHIILGEAGRPVLCGFGGAAYVGTVAPPSAPLPPELTDPAHPEGAPAEPSTDVFGLGAVLRVLVSDGASEPEPIPERRLSLARILHPWSGYHQRALLNVADQATADDPAQRPSARELAAAVRAIVPEATSTGRSHHAHDTSDRELPIEPRDLLRERGGPIAAAIIGLALLFFGVSSLLGQSPGSSARAPGDPGAATAPDVQPTPTSASMICSPIGGLPAADLDGDGCPDDAAVIGWGVVSVGSVRFAVGEHDDAVALGDWDCDGLATPAVLQASSKAIYEFASWATPGQDSSGTLVGIAPDAVELRASPDLCPTLQAIGADGLVVPRT